MITSLRTELDPSLEALETGAEPAPLFLDGAACWHLLAREQLGRLAILIDGGADVIGTSYLSRHGRLYFRTAPGADTPELGEHQRVVFEVSGATMMAQWNVVVRGTARRLASEPGMLRSDLDGRHSWRPGEKFAYFEIQAEQVTGRLVPILD